MLNGARLDAIVPVSDVDRAIEFYGGKLGLGEPERDDIPGTPGARFQVGDASLYVYKSVAAGQSRATIAGFDVDDIESTVADLRKNGVAFEEYDTPEFKTENGVATMSEDLKTAWFKDPDGNILAIGQRTRVRAGV